MSAIIESHRKMSDNSFWKKSAEPEEVAAMSTAAAIKPSHPEKVIEPLAPPKLHEGDRLTRDEFERRYSAMSAVVKAELVEGVVHIMPSPVSAESHGDQHAWMVGWLVHYEAFTPGVRVSDNATVRLDWDNEPQPDALLRILPQFGGQTRIENDYIAQAPELVVEIARSSVSYDLHDKKKEAYRRNGAREYVVWRIEDRLIDWYVLRGGSYELLALSADGIYRSEVFPGLWLDPAAMIAGNLQKVLAVLQQGLASDEHAKFVDQLKSKANPQVE